MITSIVALTFTIKSLMVQPKPVFKQITTPTKIERVVPQKPVKRYNIIRTLGNSA